MGVHSLAILTILYKKKVLSHEVSCTGAAPSCKAGRVVYAPMWVIGAVGNTTRFLSLDSESISKYKMAAHV